ncbi:hypothetical protein [Teredinibacter haidensis]|uniref:hypothetical protein n=1 Tax=Teredinibacter haidensis TaxID=2731755 RepID=UPI000948ECD6|nr:hypothetical protein [Teredinibacter haidensis]
MLRNLFCIDVYVKVYRNKFVIRLLDGSEIQKVSVPSKAFTTERLLVGSFSAAESCLTKEIKAIIPKRIFAAKPAILIQPMEMVEGGLSEIEDRVFRELALGSSAYRVSLYTGRELSTSEAVSLIHKNR